MAYSTKYLRTLIIFFTLTLVLTGCSQKNSDTTEIEKPIVDIEIDTETNTDVENHYVSTDVQNPFNQNGWWLKITGLKEYSSLETDFYTDMPAEGNIYLVLFLELRNGTPTQGYIANEDIDAIVDGKEIETTFLVNEPEGYPTIKNTIASEETKYGFLVWEVPENWKNIEIQHWSWDYTIQCIPVINLTPDDLFDPVAYNELEIMD